VTRGIGANHRRILVAVYSASIFLSASLLFWLEPMFSKMVLPVLGGSSAVWSVAMVVFQGLLLAGYLYAHLLTRCVNVRQATVIHIAVLAVATLSLPIRIASSFQSPPVHDVSLWVMALFLGSVGLPCFALSANAPLLQAWYAQSKTGDAANPYFLYRASNFGSFAVLIVYPFLIEPSFALSVQSRLWSLGYGALALAIATCGAMIWKAPPQTSVRSPAAISRSATTLREKFIWVALGFIPSGLLVAVTAHIATDVASEPFLWIMPLALYLLTFVFAFCDKPILPGKTMLGLQPFAIAWLAVLLLWSDKINWGIALFGHLAAFFVAAMVCQTRLYQRRPPASELTQFYVWMSLGGVLGGSFAALVAPQIFRSVLEYPLLGFATLLVRPDIWKAPRQVWIKDTSYVALLAAPAAFLLIFGAPVAYILVTIMALAGAMAFQGSRPVRLLALAAVIFLVTNLYDPLQNTIYRARSFYGAYKVAELNNAKFRVLYHGTTAHGAEQIRDDTGAQLTSRPEPLTYYYAGGPYSEALYAVRALAGGNLNRVALVGLGVGALSCYAIPGETWTFYELDPLIVEIAHNTELFRTVSICAPKTPVIIGDGRLTLADAKPGIDLLILDIFSSDSVPTHMLTREAFSSFKSRLAPHGAIAFNISNKNMELASVVAASAAANGMVTAVKLDDKQTSPGLTLHFQAQIAVVTRSLADMKALNLGASWRIIKPRQDQRIWTDDYSDVFSAILRKMKEQSS
jgi:spermidine synthase